MKTYTFGWQCDEAWGEIELEISEEEAELIREARRNGFGELADDIDLEDILDRALPLLDFYDPDAGQDISIYFPEELVEEVDAEDDEE